MRVDAFAIRLRARGNMEALDLGVRLCQQAARSVFPCYLMVFAPIVALAFISYEFATWAPGWVLWCSKPWVDRTVLFVLSRAAFGQTTTPGDVWRAQRQVWWKQFFLTWIWRRMSPYRSFTQPVYQIEGLSGWKIRKRVLQIRTGNSGTALLLTSAFSTMEMLLVIALLSLVWWFVPEGHELNLQMLFSSEEFSTVVTMVLVGAYAAAIAILEPFYVAAGFALYLNRRVALEAWDIEQELRRAFAS